MEKRASVYVTIDREKVRKLMIGKGFTTAEVVRRSGLSRNSVTRILNGSVRRHLASTARRLTTALDVAVEEIVKEV